MSQLDHIELKKKRCFTFMSGTGALDTFTSIYSCSVASIEVWAEVKV